MLVTRNLDRDRAELAALVTVLKSLKKLVRRQNTTAILRSIFLYG